MRLIIYNNTYIGQDCVQTWKHQDKIHWSFLVINPAAILK
jgi:hypothetical protein